jgi:hypothetical protein
MSLTFLHQTPGTSDGSFLDEAFWRRPNCYAGQRVGAANNGIWDIPVKPFTTYRASFWAKASPGFGDPLTLDLESSDGPTVYPRAQVPQITTSWAKYSVELRTFGYRQKGSGAVSSPRGKRCYRL